MGKKEMPSSQLEGVMGNISTPPPMQDIMSALVPRTQVATGQQGPVPVGVPPGGHPVAPEQLTEDPSAGISRAAGMVEASKKPMSMWGGDYGGIGKLLQGLQTEDVENLMTRTRMQRDLPADAQEAGMRSLYKVPQEQNPYKGAKTQEVSRTVMGQDGHPTQQRAMAVMNQLSGMWEVNGVPMTSEWQTYQKPYIATSKATGVVSGIDFDSGKVMWHTGAGVASPQPRAGRAGSTRNNRYNALNSIKTMVDRDVKAKLAERKAITDKLPGTTEDELAIQGLSRGAIQQFLIESIARNSKNEFAGPTAMQELERAIVEAQETGGQGAVAPPKAAGPEFKVNTGQSPTPAEILGR